jgi:hypothetical protein
VTSEELAAIRARVEIADRDDSYLRSYTGASNADLYRHPQVRADMRALLAEVARLTAEVERLSAMEPRWVNVGGSLGVWRLAVNGQFVSPVQLEPRVGGEWYEWPACVRHPDLHTACRTACARLGLSYIAPPTEGT